MAEKKDDSKKVQSVEKAENPVKPSHASATAPKYEKPRLRAYAPLHDITFTTGSGATGGTSVIVSGGGI